MIGFLRLRAAVAGAWLIVGLATIILALVTAYVGAVFAPYWDQWNFTDPASYLPKLFEKHNEHPIVLGRILFAIDYYMFGATGRWLQTMTVLLLAAQVAGFVGLGRLAGLRSVTTAVIIASFATTQVFNPHIWENLIWGFQTPFVAAFTSTVIGVWAIGNYSQTKRKLVLFVAYSCAALAPLSLSNGIITPFLFVAMSRLLGDRLRVTAGYLLIGLLGLGMYVFSSGPQSSHDFNLQDLPKLVVYTLRYLGGSLANSFDYLTGIGLAPPFERMSAAFFIGTALSLAAALSVINVLLNGRRDPARLGLATLVVFIGATAAMTAYGRLSFPPDQALSPRYGTADAVFIVSLLLLITIELRPDKLAPRQTGLWLAAASAFAILVPLSSVQLIRNLTGLQRERVSAQTALVVGAPDREKIATLAYDFSLAEIASTHLKIHGKWHFHEYWSRKLQEKSKVDLGALRSCSGTFKVTDLSGLSEDYIRVGGTIARSDARESTAVVVIDGADTIVGYGLIPNRPSDFLPMMTNAVMLDWAGHVRLEGTKGSMTALLASGSHINCRLRPGIWPPAPTPF